MRRFSGFVFAACFLAIWTSTPVPAAGPDAQGKAFRIGILALASAKSMQDRLGVFRTTLQGLGYEEGRNLAVESRFANGAYDRLAELAGELARLKVDVFLAQGEPPLIAAKGMATISLLWWSVAIRSKRCSGVCGVPVETRPGLPASLPTSLANASGCSRSCFRDRSASLSCTTNETITRLSSRM